MKIPAKDSLSSLVKLLYAIFAIVVIIFVLPKAVSCLLPFFFAWIISMIIKPLSTVLEKIVHNKRVSVLVSMLVVLGIIFVVLYNLSKAIVDEIQVIYEMFSDTKDGIPVFIWDILESLPRNLKDTLTTAVVNSDMKEIAYPAIQSALPKIGGAATKIPSAFVFTVILLLATYFMSYDEKGLKEELKKFIPERGIEKMRKIRRIFSLAIGGYVKAQLIIMCMVFTILLVGFVILDVKLALLLAFVISLIDAIPVLGTGMVLNPLAVVYLIQGDYVRAVGFVCLYVVVLLLRNFVEPKVLSGQLGIHPIITLVSMYAGLKLIGVIGMIIGPVLAIIIINFLKTEKMEAMTDAGE